MPADGKPYWDTGASFDDAVRDLTLSDLVAGLKDRNDPGLWDAFFTHMDSTLGPDRYVEAGASLQDARMDLGDEEAAEMAKQARIGQLKDRVRSRLKMMRGRL